jgi:polysaccharide biosynthesis transport protein
MEQTRANLKQEIDNILEGAKAEYQGCLRTLEGLKIELEKVKDQARDLTLKQVDYNRLQRERDSNLKVFEQVLMRIKEIDLSGMLKVNNLRLLDRAKPPQDPASPNIRLNVLVGIFLGLMLSLGTALLIELLDTTLKNAEDIQRFLAIPLLGVVPEVKIDPGQPEALLPNVTDIYAYLKPKSSLAECCRTIRTNISFMSPGKPLSRILITSASPKEGKTTIASNLGITIANTGKRVLIVDTDMRRPRIHKAFGLDNEFGISNVIMQTMTEEEAIRRTQIENLDVMTCGPIPPNPSELIGSEIFVKIMDRLSVLYDWVILDSPPVIAVTDAVILSRLVDGVVMVIEFGKTLRQVARQAKEQILGVKGHILGVVINDLDLMNREYGHYYYYYYRHYGGYYAEKEESGKDPVKG